MLFQVPRSPRGRRFVLRRPNPNPRLARRRRAFTLLECLSASAILAVVVVATCAAVSTGQSATDISLHRIRASALADALMEEIASEPYEDPNGATTPGPDAGETSRSLFNNIDDFHGYSEKAGALADASGKTYPSEYQRFARSVTCVYTTQTLAPFGDMSGILVTVTVTDSKSNLTWVLNRFVPEPQ